MYEFLPALTFCIILGGFDVSPNVRYVPSLHRIFKLLLQRLYNIFMLLKDLHAMLRYPIQEDRKGIIGSAQCQLQLPCVLLF